MITIITQNQHVALIIARAIEADEEATRYYYNEKYYVTWMTGKMVEINTPQRSGIILVPQREFPSSPQAPHSFADNKEPQGWYQHDSGSRSPERRDSFAHRQKR